MTVKVTQSEYIGFELTYPQANTIFAVQYKKGEQDLILNLRTTASYVQFPVALLEGLGEAFINLKNEIESA